MKDNSVFNYVFFLYIHTKVLNVKCVGFSGLEQCGSKLQPTAHSLSPFVLCGCLKHNSASVWFVLSWLP